MSQCPCGSSLSLTQCCGVLHAGQAATTTEQLMRSRYSAFAADRADYLLATWHPSTRPATLALEPHTRWLGLQVRAHRVLDETHAEVEFVARSRVAGGRATRLHERSRFVRENVQGGWRWFYLDGDLS